MSEPLLAEYVEPARSYRSVWLLAAFLLIGFGIDVTLGSAIVHLPGWILAAVLVLGIDLLVIYAARSTRSLLLDSDELHIGDEAIGRAEIVAVAPGVDDSLPVLGWTTGMPRGMKGLTVRLFDGQDLVIPTRFPHRLQAALGVVVDDGQEVRSAAATDHPHLAEIDARAEAVFRMAGYELPQLPFPDDELATAAAIFVIGRPPIAFVWVDEVDGLAHLQAIAVIPKRMRQGIGGQLLERACAWAAECGYRAVTLITYADVAWNGPYYAARGFVETSDVTPGLAELRAWEQAAGLDDVGRRIVMRRDL